MPERRRLLVQGTVQGVGFRPLVYRLATRNALTGSVRNDGEGVTIELQGGAAALAAFEQQLRAEAQAPAEIVRLASTTLEPVAGESGFRIIDSDAGATKRMALAADAALCADCRREMHDASNRRYHHPFISCTRCGPRYTITRALPYDRPQTTMARFPMCAACQQEYDDPADRRYHAQPISCPECGPRAWLVKRQGAVLEPSAREPDAAIAGARALISAGLVVAVKGLGGFHLAVDARSDAAVARLRQVKHRPRKPLAVMVRDLESARRLVALSAAAERQLLSPAAPIVLLPALRGHGLAAAIAPDLDDLGIFLPYAPLHELLLQGDLDAVVLTSANEPGEPMLTDNDEAMAELPADAFLLHDRDIHVGCDDSVVRGLPEGSATAGIIVRRARGYVPAALEARLLPPRRLLALGAELKVTVATLQHGELMVGRHLGDLDNPRAEAAFREEIDRLLDFGGLTPEAVAVDAHPDLYGTHYAAERFASLPAIAVQHHHAHLAAVMIEHGVAIDEPVAGIILDGLGYGLDGAIWGGEVLVGTYAASRRLAHLRYVPQPGGDRAAREPRRMATSLLWDAGLGRPELACFDAEVAAICGVRAVSPLTSSAGRLFDGVAAILGLTPPVQDYEGEAAVRLEAASARGCQDAYPLPMSGDELDTRALVAALLDDRRDVPTRAACFHNGLADGLARAALLAGAQQVALGGGCLVNRLLLRRLTMRLEEAGVRVLVPVRLPAGDGALSAGQAAVAACRLEGGLPCA
jgi:hydrogenase maturation protein HypF